MDTGSAGRIRQVHKLGCHVDQAYLKRERQVETPPCGLPTAAAVGRLTRLVSGRLWTAARRCLHLGLKASDSATAQHANVAQHQTRRTLRQHCLPSRGSPQIARRDTDRHVVQSAVLPTKIVTISRKWRNWQTR